MRRLVVVFVVLTVGLATLLFFRLRAQSRAEAGPPSSSGTLEGTRVVVAARLPGRIVQMHAQEGERVARGALLAEIDCAEPEAAVAEAGARVEAARAQVNAARAQVGALSAQARAAYRQAQGQRAQFGSIETLGQNAKRQADRTTALLGENVASEVELDRARTGEQDLAFRVNAARAAAEAAAMGATAIERQAGGALAQVQGAEYQLAAVQAAATRLRAQAAECRLVAPRAGVVTLRAREPGEVVLPGSTVYEITDNSEITVTFYVSNRDLSRVAVGARVSVVADAYPRERFAGVVRRVAEEAEFTPRTVQTRSDRDRLVYAVDASIDNRGNRLRSGMPVEVAVVVRGPR